MGLCAGFVELCAGFIGIGPVETRVDYEQSLSLFYIGSFFEKHAFEVSFHAGVDLDELLGADAAYVFAVDIYVAGLDGLNFNYG